MTFSFSRAVNAIDNKINNSIKLMDDLKSVTNKLALRIQNSRISREKS